LPSIMIATCSGTLTDVKSWEEVLTITDIETPMKIVESGEYEAASRDDCM